MCLNFLWKGGEKYAQKYENARDLAIPGASYLGDLADQPTLHPSVGFRVVPPACAVCILLDLCFGAVPDLRRLPYPSATLASQPSACAVCCASSRPFRCNSPDFSGKLQLPVPPLSNFRIAPDVILQRPGMTHLQLAPLTRHSGQTYHAAPGLRRLLHPSPGLAANLRPSPEPDLQLARHITPGSHRMLQASASPVTQHSARAECCVTPAKLATSP